MEDLLLCAIVFALVFIGRFVLYLIGKKSKKKKDKSLIGVDIRYLVNKFNLDIKKLNTTGIAVLLSFTDALIVALTFLVVITVTDNIILELLFGLVVVVVLIILVNEIIGRILIKRGYDK